MQPSRESNELGIDLSYSSKQMSTTVSEVSKNRESCKRTGHRCYLQDDIEKKSRVPTKILQTYTNNAPKIMLETISARTATVSGQIFTKNI
jgi:hypothetical protein